MTAQATTHSIPLRFLTTTGAALSSAFMFLAENSRGARAAREAQRLSALTDAELAALGLRRNEILSRAFGPFIHL